MTFIGIMWKFRQLTALPTLCPIRPEQCRSMSDGLSLTVGEPLKDKSANIVMCIYYSLVILTHTVPNLLRKKTTGKHLLKVTAVQFS